MRLLHIFQPIRLALYQPELACIVRGESLKSLLSLFLWSAMPSRLTMHWVRSIPQQNTVNQVLSRICIMDNLTNSATSNCCHLLTSPLLSGCSGSPLELCYPLGLGFRGFFLGELIASMRDSAPARPAVSAVHGRVSMHPPRICSLRPASGRCGW